MVQHSGKIRLGLIYGGRSGEHDISVRSADSVKRALSPERYQVSEYFIEKNGKWRPGPLIPEPGANVSLDAVFPLLHGTFGEDGTVQGLLELAGLPYVGAGVMASALSMDKAMTKRVCEQAGLPVARYAVLSRTEAKAGAPKLPFGFPVFVKPANLGSSVGITKAKSEDELQSALQVAAQYDRKVIVEQGIVGREFECSVLDGEPAIAATPCEILPSQEFYTYEDKYLLDTAKIELPAKLTPEQTRRIQQLAVACFGAVGCEGMARVDFLMDGASGEFYVNEINTIPGFTSISMFPKMWEYSGIGYAELLDRLVDSALRRAEEKRQIRYTR